MKRKHSYFLRNSLRAGMPAVTAALLTIAGFAAAAEKAPANAPAKKTPAATKVTAAPAPQKKLSPEQQLTETVLKKIDFVKANNIPGRYMDAFRAMSEIDKLVTPKLKLVNGKMCPPSYLAKAYAEYESLLPEIRSGAADEYFKQANDLFQKGLKDPKADSKVYDQAKTFAYDALAIYYCGKTWADLGHDVTILDAAMVNANRDFHNRVRVFIDNCDLRTPGPALVKKVETVKRNELDRATQLIAQADVLASPESKQYRDALIRLQEAKGYLYDKNGAVRAGSRVAEIERIWKDKFEQVRKLHGEELFTKAREIHAQALHAGATVEGVAKAEEAEKIALEARIVYYTGMFAGQVASPKIVNNYITHLNQDFSIDVEEFIRSCKKIANAKKFADETHNSKVDPNFSNRQREISTLYTQAEKMYRDKQYSKARDLCEQIFLKDPLNQRAIRLLDKVYKKLYYYSELRVFNEMRKNDAETVWSWVPSIVRHDNLDNVVAERAPGSDALLDKLNKIKISVNFKDLTLNEVIDSVSHKTRNADPEQQGINIIVKGEVDNTKKVTLENIKDMPVSKVLDYIVAELGVGWSITDNWIITIGNDVLDYEIREFPLRKSAYNDITNKDDDSGDAEEEDSNKDEFSFGDEISKGIASRKPKMNMASDEDLKAVFAKRGVSFDANSVISYNNNEQKVFAKNRRSELIKLEKLIRQYDVENPMILVESKILEIAVNDQEELGFDWILSCDNNTNSSRSFNMSSPLRSSGFTNNIMLNSLNVIPNFHLSGANLNLNLYLTITAVDRTDRMELLSTPKVVATNGDEAEVKMVRQEYFPESWNEPDVSVVSGDSGNIEFQPSYPEFGDPTDVGISFTVTPTISENKKTILLALKPTVTDFTGWTDYSYEVAIIRSTDPDDDPPDAAAPVYPNATDFGPNAIWELLDNSEQRTKVRMMMPEISVREVETNVKVYDGQTLLIGGLIIDKHTTMEDRFPILGDLPLIGRLFTKSASATTRTNMLISVTTRLIYGDGSLYGESQPNGLPDFGR